MLGIALTIAATRSHSSPVGATQFSIVCATFCASFGYFLLSSATALIGAFLMMSQSGSTALALGAGFLHPTIATMISTHLVIHASYNAALSDSRTSDRCCRRD